MQRTVQPIERPRCYIIHVESRGKPNLAYRMFSRTLEEASAEAVADYNSLFRVADGAVVFTELGR